MGKYKVHKLHKVRTEVMYLVFTRMPGESYRRLFRSLLLCSCEAVHVHAIESVNITT